MRKVTCFFLVFVTIFFFHANASAETQNNFYLHTRTAPQKIIPSTLQLNIIVGESKDIKVDTIPSNADTAKLVWELIANTGIADITWEGNFCTVHAKSAGSGVINVSEPGITTSSIKLTVTDAIPTTLSLAVPCTSIPAGDSVLIRANYMPQNAQIIWTVQGEDRAIFSYGGALCRVKGMKPGEVTVRASIADTDLAQDITLKIEGQPVNYMSIIKNLLNVLIFGGIALLLLSLILWLHLKRSQSHE